MTLIVAHNTNAGYKPNHRHSLVSGCVLSVTQEVWSAWLHASSLNYQQDILYVRRVNDEKYKNISSYHGYYMTVIKNMSVFPIMSQKGLFRIGHKSYLKQMISV